MAHLLNRRRAATQTGSALDLHTRPYYANTMARRPILSPIARPGRRYISGMIWLGVVIALALAVLAARVLLG
jgi:hypothetical protein